MFISSRLLIFTAFPMALQEEMEVQGNFLFRYRGVLPLIILVFGLAVFIYNKYSGTTYVMEQGLEESFRYICLAVCVFGLLIRVYTVGHTPKNTSGRNTSEGQVADEVNTTGIYSVVRHPLYVGNYFMWLGIGMLTMDLWFNVAFTFMYWVYYERIMYAEEQFLRKKFGRVYTDWAASVPAFIPSFKNFKKPKLHFSWKKVFYKEKAGILWVFVTFYAFVLLGYYIEWDTFEVVKGFWLNALIGAVAYYAIVKVTNVATGFFNEEGR